MSPSAFIVAILLSSTAALTSSPPPTAIDARSEASPNVTAFKAPIAPLENNVTTSEASIAPPENNATLSKAASNVSTSPEPKRVPSAGAHEISVWVLIGAGGFALLLGGVAAVVCYLDCRGPRCPKKGHDDIAETSIRNSLRRLSRREKTASSCSEVEHLVTNEK
ncbi:hypothetical protein QR680_005244 [Steinernema hermaphroditum]|uniref:Uncharacterized protein n=1 Tax=Steinernema hermaphroditum TaxID=289476 RepID=A0AA39HTL8_9BILA|nr:hypothetical protein QR680_005244 [Steinernema hermaphroditum]